MTPRGSVPGPARLLAAPLAALLMAGACSDSGPAACGPVTEEEFDTQSSLHIASGTDVEYLTWPPTSGPHVTATAPSGALDEPLPGPVQVTVLESGKALIQYDGISGRDIERLEELAGENVVVAPGTDLPDAVVATAWTTKQTCSEVDMGEHRDFIEVYALAEPAN